jgi:DNA-binding PadR family transcriptional regulator
MPPPRKKETELDTKAPLFKGLVRGMLPAYLLYLMRSKPLHGTDMIKSLAHMSHGVWKPSPGSVYPVLRRLEKEGVITGRWQRGQAAPKRVYRLTEKGRADLPKLQARLLAELRAARHIIDEHIEALEAHGWDGTHGER